MTRIVVYQKPACRTCRQVSKTLKELGVDFDVVDYYTDPVPKRKLKELLNKLGMNARQLLRTREETYRKLGLADKQLSEDEIVELMIRYPELMQRPIVEKGGKAILARPAGRIREIL